MIHVLVVEDSPTQTAQFRLLLEEAGFRVTTAVNGLKGLSAIQQEKPDIVLTDLDMPEMNGLELVETVRAEHSELPIILMTAMGSEEIALQALRQGAASYIPKRVLENQVKPTILEVVAASRAEQHQQRLEACLVEVESCYRLATDPALVRPLVSHLQRELKRIHLSDETGITQTSVALTEAMDNAIFHGNLELSSQLRESPDGEYGRMAQLRLGTPPYSQRFVEVRAKISEDEFICRITDEGPGFDPALIPDPCEAANLEKLSGRGLLLIQTFMDEVTHNATGNEITLIKRRSQNGCAAVA